MGSPEVVPDIENSKENSPLARSSIRFPYLDQDDAVDIAKNIFEVSGNSCEKFALAAKLNVAADGGGFNLRVGTAKMYGFVSGGEKGSLQLTDIGLRVIDPQTEKAARAESFLMVPLYKAIYELYKGQMLPPNPALEAQIEKLGVAPKVKDKARQVFQRSATQAGYFAFGNNRLVAPTFKPTSADVPPPPPADGQERGKGGSNSGGGNPPSDLPPYVQVLLSKLPSADTQWPLEGRKKWLEAALKIFDLMYTADDSGELSISLTKTSAN